MKIDANKMYNMPLIMGAVHESKRIKIHYPQVETLVFQYLTDPHAIADLLPMCYKPAKQSILSIIFMQNSGLSQLAGGGYRMLIVSTPAIFDGKKDHVDGDYILAVFENQVQPIIAGREDLGVPKLFADISPIKQMPDGHLRCEASYWGHMLLGLDVPPLKRQSIIVKTIAAKQANSRPWLAYKYIPSVDGPPDADYPMLVCNETKIEKLWMGKKANLRFGTARVEDIGIVKNLVDALATLTVLKPIQALHFTGSAVLRYDLSHRLY